MANVNEQTELARHLAAGLVLELGAGELEHELVNTMDVLDALAMAGLILARAPAGTNPASEAYAHELTR
jgi:hypothetical protein